jgi:hypothetical protein
MATLDQLEKALVLADQAGNVDDARRLAQIIKDERARPGFMAFEAGAATVPGTEIQEPEPTLIEQAQGVGEAALTTATGAIGGTVGHVTGALKGIAEEIVTGQFGKGIGEKSAGEAARALTYEPRTATGKEYVQTIGEAAQQLTPLAPMTAEMGAIGQAVKGVAPIAKAQAVQKVAPVVQAVKDRLPAAKIAKKEPINGSVGAAAVDAGELRQVRAGELPVPIKLTKGQKTREFEAQQFERETAKRADVGEPIRKRYQEQNLQLQQNLDDFIDTTGAKAFDLRSLGITVDKAVRESAAKAKTKVRALYKKAEKSGELEAPVTLTNLVRHINESAPESEVANVLKTIRAKAVQLGAATEGQSGNLIPAQTTLRNSELIRRSINNATNMEPTNIRQSSIMKNLIDEQTEGAGGDIYRQARAERAKYAKTYENVGLVKRLLGLKKGSGDRAIAIENILQESVLAPSTSLDSIKHLRKVLGRAGGNGKQAWSELQGGVLRHIKDQALKNVATDEAGNRLVSASQLDRVITQLDKTGKLDFIFGKKGAEQLNTLNDVAKVVMTAPPGTVNFSNTATAIAAMLDLMGSATTGVPAPIATGLRALVGSIKDAKLKKKVKEALGDN